MQLRRMEHLENKTYLLPLRKKVQTSIRVLRGHSGAVTALHCVTRREVWDLVGDREDAGFLLVAVQTVR